MSVVFLYAFFAHLRGRADQVSPADRGVHGRAREIQVSCLQDIVDLMTPSAVYQAGILVGPTLLPRLEVPRFGERSSG